MEKRAYANVTEKEAPHISGFLGLLLVVGIFLGSILMSVGSIRHLVSMGEGVPEGADYSSVSVLPSVLLLILGVVLFVTSFILLGGLKRLNPNEAYVFTLFGRYYGSLKREGFYMVNPFVSAINPVAPNLMQQAAMQTTKAALSEGSGNNANANMQALGTGKKVSMKVTTLNNEKQKINDAMGNPIIIGIVVIWKVREPEKAVFNVDNYPEFLSIHADSSLRNIVRLYPYDSTEDEDEMSLRGSSEEVALRIREELQAKVECAGLEILETRITNLSYAPEIASAMLQRQQAQAIIDARQKIVEGAVSMVGMALDRLDQESIVALDAERKAQMVSNLLVILCGNKDAQPIVNSGSIY